MRTSQVAMAVASHLNRPFGLPGFAAVYREEKEAPTGIDMPSTESWGHTTVVDGDKLLSADGEDVTGDFDFDEEEGEDDSEEEEEDDSEEEEEDDSEEEEEDDSEEEEEDDSEEEEEDDSEEEDGKKAKGEKEVKSGKKDAPAEVDAAQAAAERKLNAAFAKMRRAETEYHKARAESTKEVTAAELAPELVSRRNELIKERSKLDPLTDEDAPARIAEIDIEVADISTTLASRLSGAENQRQNSLRDAERSTRQTIDAALEAVGAIYPQLDSDSDKYDAEVADLFNALYGSYSSQMSVAEASQKALNLVIKRCGLTATGVKPAKKAKAAEESVRQAVNKRKAQQDKQPVRRGKGKGTAEATGVGALLKQNFSDKKVQAALNKELGISFDL